MSTYNNEPRQTIWELWFVTSVILFIASVFIGTTPGSVQMFPHFDMWLGVVFVNLIACITVGYRK